VHAKDDSWTDFLNWQEEGKEWKRYAADETRQIATWVDPSQMPVSATMEGIVAAHAVTANEDDEDDIEVIEVIEATLVDADAAVDEIVASPMEDAHTSSQTEEAEMQAHAEIRRICAQITGAL
jgi:hypothetical protein